MLQLHFIFIWYSSGVAWSLDGVASKVIISIVTILQLSKILWSTAKALALFKSNLQFLFIESYTIIINTAFSFFQAILYLNQVLRLNTFQDTFSYLTQAQLVPSKVGYKMRGHRLEVIKQKLEMQLSFFVVVVWMQSHIVINI